MAQVQYYGTGRRKHSVARVRLVPGEGRIIINKRDLNEYFGLETLKLIVKQPLTLTETIGKYDVLVLANGGGMSGQAGAIRRLNTLRKSHAYHAYIGGSPYVLYV